MIANTPSAASVPEQDQFHFDPYAIQDIPCTIELTYMCHALPNMNDIMFFNSAYNPVDPLDITLRNQLKSNEFGVYTTSMGSADKYLSPDHYLQRCSEDSLPRPMRNIVCFTPLLDVAERSISIGMRIPAGLGNNRGVIVGHFCQYGLDHFLLCVHGTHNAFLLRVPDAAVVKTWPYHEEVVTHYQNTLLGPMFRGEHSTDCPGLAPIVMYYCAKIERDREWIRSVNQAADIVDLTRDLPWYAQWGQELL